MEYLLKIVIETKNPNKNNSCVEPYVAIYTAIYSYLALLRAKQLSTNATITLPLVRRKPLPPHLQE